MIEIIRRPTFRVAADCTLCCSRLRFGFEDLRPLALLHRKDAATMEFLFGVVCPVCRSEVRIEQAELPPPLDRFDTAREYCERRGLFGYPAYLPEIDEKGASAGRPACGDD